MTISMATLVKRINRKLAQDDEQIRTPRRERDLNDLGTYYAVNVSRNFITALHVDPIEWGKELGVLRADETVAQAIA